MTQVYLKELPSRNNKTTGFRKKVWAIADNKPGYWAKVFTGSQKEVVRHRANVVSFVKGYEAAQRKIDGKFVLFVRKTGATKDA